MVSKVTRGSNSPGAAEHRAEARLGHRCDPVVATIRVAGVPASSCRSIRSMSDQDSSSTPYRSPRPIATSALPFPSRRPRAELSAPSVILCDAMRSLARPRLVVVGVTSSPPRSPRSGTRIRLCSTSLIDGPRDARPGQCSACSLTSPRPAGVDHRTGSAPARSRRR